MAVLQRPEYGLTISQPQMPTTAQLAELGLSHGWVRCLVTDIDAFDAALRDKHWPNSIKVCALLEGQTKGIGGNFEGWVPTVQGFVNKFQGRVQALECANELDIWHLQPPVGAPNPLLTPEFAAKLVTDVAPYIRQAGMKVIAPSVASSDWRNYLTEMSKHLGNTADYQAFHPYGKRIGNHPPLSDWEQLADALEQARGAANRPIVLTEIGVTVEDAGESEQQRYIQSLFDLMKRQSPDQVTFFCYFAWNDRVGHPRDGNFGLTDTDPYRRRDIGTTFEECCLGWMGELGTGSQTPLYPVYRYQMGFGRWAAQEAQLLGQPLENEAYPVAGVTLQRTDRGLLFWANVPADSGGTFVFLDADGRRHLWQGAQSPSTEVAAAAESPPFRYEQGFAAWARNEPTLLGSPLEQESGPVSGVSFQRTSRGVLIWAQVPSIPGGAFIFQAADGSRRVWTSGAAHSTAA